MNRRSSDPPVLRGFTYSRLLGSGGFADVFLYDQHLPKRQVAVKVLLADGLTPAGRAAFVAEANLMAQLEHPYIVKIYHADVAEDGRPYLIMEYLSGQNLAEQYKRHPLTVTEALRTGVRLSSAIATAHVAGILHRDIKPANVLTNSYGWPALTDFGISSALEDDLVSMTTTREELAQSGATTGSQSVGMSIPWSPPEMFDEDPKPDVRSDVFSLAATIWTLLAGRTPFEITGRSNQSLDLISRIERGAITPMERADVPPSLIAVLRKGMATHREQRFATAVDFARALQRVELELSYAPTTIDVPNLVVPQPEARTDDDHEDATRARNVTSIAAQAPVAPVPRMPVTEATVVRGAPTPVIDHTVIRPGGTPTPTVIGAESPAVVVATPKPRRVGVIVGVVVAVVVAAVVGVVIATNLGSAPESAADRPTEVEADPDTGPLQTGAVPTPQLVSATADGTTVTFTWANPDPVDGDGFIWERTDGAGDGERVPTTESAATIPDVAVGTTVCIDVYVRRSGELSPEPLSACLP